MNARPWPSLAVMAGTALLLLAGCAPAAPAPVASPTTSIETPSPTTEPTVEPVSAPEPRLDLTCDELAAALPLSATFSTAVASRSRAATEFGAHPSWPQEFPVRSVGGLVCEFSNGQPQSDVRGDNAAYVGVRVLVLPDPGAQWDAYVDYYGIASTGTALCSTFGGDTACNLNALASDRWVEVSIDGAVTEAAGATLANAVVAAVTSAGPGAAPWSPPADTLAIPDNCTDYISAAALQTATGLTAPLAVRARDGGGWSLLAGAEEIDGSPSCFLAFDGADAGIGTMKVMRGGTWALAEVQDLVASTPITVAGLGPDDAATLRCGAADAWCIVDLQLGGNWIELYLWEDDPGAPLDRRAAVQRIAAEVVANVGA